MIIFIMVVSAISFCTCIQVPWLITVLRQRHVCTRVSVLPTNPTSVVWRTLLTALSYAGLSLSLSLSENQTESERDADEERQTKIDGDRQTGRVRKTTEGVGRGSILRSAASLFSLSAQG